MVKRRDDLKAGSYEKAVKSIEEGHGKEALKHFGQFWKETKATHDRLIEYAELFLTYIAERLGEESVREAWEFVMNDSHRRMMSVLKGLSGEDLVRTIANMQTLHGGDFYIEEEEDRYIIYNTYCGSGGEMLKEGKLDTTDRHPMKGGTFKKSYPWAFSQKGIPYYCAHCGFIGDRIEEWSGVKWKFEFGRQFDKQGKPVDEPCKWTIMKR